MKQQNSKTAKQRFRQLAIGMLCLFTMATTTISCQKDEIISNRDSSQKKADESTFKREFVGDSIILQNPYSVKNMTEALSNIKKQNPTSGFVGLAKFNIKASHRYIKFKPRNEEEVFLLKADSTTHFFDYRLDCEYTDSYLDNRAPENDSITDYYAAIPINKTLPNVPYDVIEELYIPEQDTYFSDTYENSKYLITYKIKDKTDLYNHLIFEAFTLTNNQDEVLEPDSTETEKWFFGKKWRPKGTINIQDECSSDYVRVGSTGIVPLEGAKILMRQWFTIDSGITNSNGYFQTGTVRGKARYIIQWERYNYSIRTGNFGQAELRGPNLKNQDWNYNILDGADKFHGHIHRAAYHYYYKDINGLRRPPENGSWKPQMKIGAFNEANESINGDYRCGARFMGILPAIRIYNPQVSSCDVYGTTIHELAHSSHFTMMKTVFRDTEKKVKESWARGVQWKLTKTIYPNYNIYYYSQNPDYTTVVKDMIDGVDLYPAPAGYDFVTGYTIRQIEDALKGEKTWIDWKNHIQSSFDNPTENNLDTLYNHF